MSPKNIVGGLVGKAAGAARNPVGTAGQALGLAKGAVATGMTVAEGVAHVAADRLRARQGKGAEKVHVSPDKAAETEQSGQPKADEQEAAPQSTAKKAAKKAPAAAKKAGAAAKKAAEDTAKKAAGGTAKKAAPAKKSGGPAKKASPKKSAASGPPEPQIVLAEPAPPAEPPIDIVEQVLAAEGQQQPTAGHATEPKAASRDETHGEAAMQRAEFDEIAEEQAEALATGQVDIETPVGTTGADVGHNPDTAEADLQQPATEPLVDPATTKEIKSEATTGRKAARTKKS